MFHLIPYEIRWKNAAKGHTSTLFSVFEKISQKIKE